MPVLPLLSGISGYSLPRDMLLISAAAAVARREHSRGSALLVQNIGSCKNSCLLGEDQRCQNTYHLQSDVLLVKWCYKLHPGENYVRCQGVQKRNRVDQIPYCGKANFLENAQWLKISCIYIWNKVILKLVDSIYFYSVNHW